MSQRTKNTMGYKHFSATATLAALIRKDLTNIPYSQEIFQEIPLKSRSLLLDGSFKLLKWWLKVAPEQLSGISFVEGRCKLLNHIIDQTKNCVILELASGLSSRGLEYSKKEHLIIDSDLPSMIQFKEKVVHKIFANNGEKVPANYHFIPVDVMNRDDFKKVGEFYKKEGKNRPLIIAHEGFLPYLTMDERVVLRDNISWFFKNYAPQGTWITPDLSNFDIVTRKDLHPFIKLLFRMLQKVSKRTFYGFRDHEHIHQFLKEGNLAGELYDGAEVIKNLYCIKKYKMSLEKALELSAYYQLYDIKYSTTMP